MNKAQKRPTMTKVLSMILALIMVLSLLPLSGFTAEPQAADTSTFMRIFHLDCGRKYFTVGQINDLIDAAAANNYTHVELAFGNDGLRFLLDDMSVGDYATERVSKAIHSANEAYYDFDTDELTQSDMEAIISHAKEKGIGIIPMIDVPGHTNALVTAMKSLGVSVDVYDTNTNSEGLTTKAFSASNTETVRFVNAFVQKYVDYFASKGCQYFNLGADECGYGNTNDYSSVAKMIGDLSDYIKAKNMTAMMFNDGFRTDNTLLNALKSRAKDIIICYWTYSGYSTPNTLAEAGFRIINTHNKWYYVAGNETGGSWGYKWALNNINGDYSDCTVVDNAKNQTYKTNTGCMLAFWCDNPRNTVNYKNVKAYIEALAAKNPTVFVASSTDVDPTPTVSPESTETPAVTENIPITVTAGSTATAEIKSYNYSGKDYTTEDPSIATVAVTGENAHEGTVKYESANGVTYREIATSRSWTKTDYYYKVGNNYYPVYAKYETDGWGTYYYYYYGYSTTDTASDVIQIAYSRRSNSTVSGLYTKAGTETVEAYTKITFKGLTAGKTTYVTIGHVRYTIYVIAEDLTNADKFYIQLWFTNVTIETENTDETTSSWDARTAKYLTIEAKQAYGEKGVSLSSLVPQQMVRYENDGTYWIKEQSGKAPTTLILYKGAALSSSEFQKVWQTDRCGTNAGVTFQYVRYLSGNWQVSNTGEANDWTTVESIKNSTSESGRQVIAYYSQRTNIVDEVYTDIVEWPTLPHTNLKKGYCLLDYRVVYASGLKDPTSFPQTNKTMSFSCGSGVQNSAYDSTAGAYYRTLNTINATAAPGFEIYMITLTPTNDNATTAIASSASGATSYTYDNKTNSTEKVVWVDDEANLPADFKSADKKYTSSPSGTSTTYHVGGAPNLESVDVYQSQGLLITYYIRAVQTEDSLKVHYRDRSANNTEFYNYNISVMSGTVFDPRIDKKSPNWKGDLDYGTVENSLGKSETVSADLSTMPEIGAKYRYSNYTCVEVQKSDDLKEVFLYYTFTYNVTFVVDFGLPLIIEPKDVGDNLANANITRVAVEDSYYADVTANEDKSITYKLTQTFKGSDTVTVTYYGTNLATYNDGSVTFNIKIIPASNVYYEDSFATFKGGTGTAAAAQWSIEDNNGSKITENDVTVTNQALSTLGSKDIYGYDKAYKESTKYSMGSAHKVTVSSAMADNWADGSAWPTATFTFKGTGFDIISLTDNTSGTIFVDVYKGDKAEGDTVKSYFVDNYYGYKQVRGADGKVTWVVDKTSENSLYQIPVMKVTDLGYDTYTVVIKAAYSKWFDHTDNKKYTFVLDAIRVYNPMDKDNETYAQDDEGYPQYIKLRDSIADKSAAIDGDAKMVFIDGGNTADIETYANYGPNNEVYLAKGQAISFNVPNAENIATVQIGAKSPDGGAKMKVTVGSGNAVETGISTATEMYYQLEGVSKGQQIVIANTGDKILSLTNLKITFTNKSGEVKLAALTDEDQANAVATVRALFAAPTPEVKTFEPERFDASWNSVRVGQKATLTVKTSDDVEAITVNGETVDNYKPRYERSGWGWWAEKVEYRVFTYTVTATETMDYEVAAVNAEGTASEPVICTLTVKPAQTNWWDDIWNGFFGKWF